MFGHSRYFKQFLQNNWRDLYRVAYVWTHDSELASDLVQETITRCLKNRQKFENEKQLKVWLFKVMSNCWRDHFRRQKNNIDLDNVDLYSTTNLEEEHYRLQVMKQVQKAFELLKAEYREALSLIVVEGMSYEDVSRVLDVPIGTVMSRVSRARSRLKELMVDVHLKDELATNVWSIK
jgi:RNA polymerase sigma-70 factor (ECF subfamily)